MVIPGESDYLVLNKDIKGNTDSISLFSDYNGVLNTWTSYSRVSPIFRLNLDGKQERQIEITKGNCIIYFLGPISPKELELGTFSKTNLWLTYGYYNIVCLASAEEEEEETILDINLFIEKNKIRFEKWNINQGTIISKEYGEFSSEKKLITTDLLTKYDSTDLLYSPVREFLTLSKACFERLKYIKEDIALEINEIQQYVTIYLHNVENTELTKFGFLTTINACLSRFTSQTVSGTSPITSTESHLWGHSLLGIGLANLALHNLVCFLSDTIGKYDISTLLSNYIRNNNQITLDLYKLDSNNSFWIEDKFRDLIDNPDIHYEQQVPTISYFSGRDGFRNQHNTLSAPLESLYSCNTSGASLKTITHEVSHMIIRSCLANILPDLNDEQSMDSAFKVIKNNFADYEQKVQGYLLTGFITASSIELSKDYNKIHLRKIILDSYAEVDEIMTHTFDFVYFYQWNSKLYLSELWSTWSEIPNIQNRINEYVIRSICALMSQYTKEADCNNRAKEEFLAILNELKNAEPKKSLKFSIMQDAIDFVQNSWNEKEEHNSKKISLHNLTWRRRYIVKFVRTFLYSEHLNSIIHSDSWAVTKDIEQMSKDIKRMQIIEQPIGNILNFIDIASQGKTRSMAESLLIYYTLAFNYEGGA